ncbi:MAG: hypothetical protein Q4E87_00925 [bacterium]|nr:hypothetical protein [bacterium]
MKTKGEILQAINQCSKMNKAGEQSCCSKCPYRNKSFCYTALLKDVKEYVMNDVGAFISYLRHNIDFVLKDTEETDAEEHVICGCIDVDKLDKHFEDMKELDKI